MAYSTTEIERLCLASMARSRERRLAATQRSPRRERVLEDLKALALALGVVVGLTLLALALYALGVR